jgi:hypothetical protein
MHIVAPYDVAGVVNPDESWIVTIADGIWLPIFVNPLYWVGSDIPVDAVLAIAEEQGCAAVALVAPEDPDKFIFMREDGTIENSRGFGNGVPG